MECMDDLTPEFLVTPDSGDILDSLLPLLVWDNSSLDTLLPSLKTSINISDSSKDYNLILLPFSSVRLSVMFWLSVLFECLQLCQGNDVTVTRSVPHCLLTSCVVIIKPEKYHTLVI